MSIKFLVLGGAGVFWVWGGGGRFYFYGRGNFSERLGLIGKRKLRTDTRSP